MQPDASLSSPDAWALPPLTPPPDTVFIQGSQGQVGHDLVRLSVPGSKYYTLRYLLAAALAEGESCVVGPALSDDTAVLVRALRALGAAITWAPGADATEGWALRMRGFGGRPQRPPDGVIQAGNAGAVLRLLLGIGAVVPQIRFETDHPHSLGRRPNADLLEALESLGLLIEAQWPDGLLPITLRGGPPRGGPVRVSGARSSQYLSALLFLAPLLARGLDITVFGGLHSAPLVRATLRTLERAGIWVAASPDLLHLHVYGEQQYQPGDYVVPGDAPSAAALLSAALALDAPLVLAGLDAAEADARAVLEVFGAMGATISAGAPGTGVALGRGGQLHSISLDGDGVIDSVPVLVAAACFAEGVTRFENVATLRLKESNRIDDLCAELRRAGCDVEPEPEAIVVRGQPGGFAGGVTVDGHDDHRLVQALAIVALRCREGLTITGAGAIAKSYPHFFDDLARLGARVRALDVA